MLGHRIGLTGQQRLIQLQALGAHDSSVGRHLVAGPQLQEVVEHDRRHVDLGRDPVAHSTRRRRAQYGQLIQLPFGKQLLDDPDQRVEDDDQSEQAVGRRPEHEDQHEHRAQNRVESGQDVGPDDLEQGPTRTFRGVVDLATSYPLSHFLGRQTRRCGRRSVRSGRASDPGCCIFGHVGDGSAQMSGISDIPYPAKPQNGRCTPR